ncbi:hypothetical protein SAY87_030061 [Trapa incisa]|uniref:Leucine-rich repeat-containing N-terminal plant-type domain-containing protein n=1 Tax=Trapa incisa TaxID=236973 RepID=A0AAN7K9B4_9MYRT|nr:hypothetical protein SAY87_030061 [Trapa incisa]
MAGDQDMSGWTDLLHSWTKLLEQAAPSRSPAMRLEITSVLRNLDQLEALSKKHKARTLRAEAPSRSVAATRLLAREGINADQLARDLKSFELKVENDGSFQLSIAMGYYEFREDGDDQMPGEGQMAGGFIWKFGAERIRPWVQLPFYLGPINLEPGLSYFKRLVPGWGLQSSDDFCSWPGITCDVENNGNSIVQKLDLSNRSLRGNITLILEFGSLKSLDLSSNSFHGPVPPELGSLSLLEFLDLSFNGFNGSIPRELGNLINLRSLNLSSNLLVGEIPDELQSLENLQEFQVSSNILRGAIPLWLGKLSSLRVFFSL